MDILKLIKSRRSIRKYQDKPIPEKILEKIIDAGVWGPSITTFLQIQPWKFVVVYNKEIKKNLSIIIKKKSKKSGIGVNILLRSASEIINEASVVICIYSSGEIEKVKNKYIEFYYKFAKLAPVAKISAISAAIQNMILVAENLGIGSCWLDTPLLCQNDINKLLNNNNNQLIALLTLGYAAEKGKRSKRKSYSEAVTYLK